MDLDRVIEACETLYEYCMSTRCRECPFNELNCSLSNMDEYVRFMKGHIKMMSEDSLI